MKIQQPIKNLGLILLVLIWACNTHPQKEADNDTEQTTSLSFTNEFDTLVDVSIFENEQYSLFHPIYESKVKLSDFLNTGADYYLIDFWASWNEQCRNFNTNFKWQYDTLRSCGVEIIGIGTHDTLNSFIMAVEDDHTPWIQLYDIDNYLAESLELKGVPVKVLVDNNGKVVRVFKEEFSLNSLINKPEPI